MMRGRAVALLEAGHICALSLWAGALAMTAATAAIAFPTMRSLAPQLPAYEAYPDDHWVIAGGHVMERVFTASDIAQLALAAIAVACFVPVVIRSTGARRLVLIRAIVLIGLVASLAQYTFVMRGQMTSDLMAFWIHAENGDVEAADAARASFDRAHPVASARLTAHLVGVLVAIGLAAISVALRGQQDAVGAARA